MLKPKHAEGSVKNILNTNLQKSKPIRDKNYIKYISSLPCLCCSNPHSVAHHEQLKGHGAKGSKTDDTRTLPLCARCHRERHDTGRDSFYRKWNIDTEFWIAKLNKIYKEHINDSIY